MLKSQIDNNRLVRLIPLPIHATMTATLWTVGNGNLPRKPQFGRVCSLARLCGPRDDMMGTTMIPREINREHVLQAVEYIRQHGVPPGRQSRKFLLRHADEVYPPKYVVSLACRIAKGQALGSGDFGGGPETNTFLTGLGFEIIDKSSTVLIPAGTAETTARSASRRRSRRSSMNRRHSERCPACKERVKQLLCRLYGRVEEGKSFGIPTRPDALTARFGVPLLARIYDELAALRGHDAFVRREHLPPCDYFVPQPGFVLEFDETQHFTAPRRVSLEQYGTTAPMGFSVQRWIELCRRIDAHDNDPPDRDEQRAWYDTLRDFLPVLLDGFLPTVRLLAGEQAWCDLDPGDAEDRALFRDWFALPCRFEVEQQWTANAKPFWGRVIVCGPWYGGVPQARHVLNAVCDRWPGGQRTTILVTCGGFVSFKWPSSITRNDIGDILNPDPDAVAALFKKADRVVDDLLTDSLRSKLKRCTDAITIGVDSFKAQVSVASERIRDLHVELVYFVDLRNNHIRRTGKIYPTSGQEDGLVRITDMTSRFTTFDNDTVFLLGCHDLNAFSPRGNRVVRRRWRKDTIGALHQSVKRRTPRIVIHHPHVTDSPRIWRTAWNRLVATARSVDLYASAGRYHNSDADVRAPLGNVLRSTVRGDSVDFVVKITCQ